MTLWPRVYVLVAKLYEDDECVGSQIVAEYEDKEDAERYRIVAEVMMNEGRFDSSVGVDILERFKVH